MNKFKEYMNESKENDIYDEIMDFFADNPAPPDKDIHDLANKLGIDEHKFEGYIYAILGSILGTGKAKKKGLTEKDVDRKELAMGIKIEMEHTKNKAISKRIALDHLAELPDYYTRLIKMEKE
jgi:hypothetical protein